MSDTARDAAPGAAGKTPCWLCDGLGAIAVHTLWSQRRGKPLWTAHRPDSCGHPVRPCPVCSQRVPSAEHAGERVSTYRDRLREVIGEMLRTGGGTTVLTSAVMLVRDAELDTLRAENTRLAAKVAEWERVHAEHNEIHDIGETAVLAWRRKAERAETELTEAKKKIEDLSSSLDRVAAVSDRWQFYAMEPQTRRFQNEIRTALYPPPGDTP